jgi:hypothetical protein
MALSVEQYVLWFQVSIDDVFIMQSFNGANNLSRIQFSTIFLEPLLFSQVCEELTAIQEINEEVQLAICLEGIVQAHDVRVLDLLKDVSLGYQTKTTMSSLFL